jgi:hypothetical protein
LFFKIEFFEIIKSDKRKTEIKEAKEIKSLNEVCPFLRTSMIVSDTIEAVIT